MNAGVLDSHPTLTAVLFGLYELEPGVFTPISFEDRLTAVGILADRLDPVAPPPHLVSYDTWFIPGEPSPEIETFVRSFTITEEMCLDENQEPPTVYGFGERPCHSLQPSPGPSNTAASTTAHSDPGQQKGKT